MNRDTRDKLEARLRYFQDLGLSPYYRDRASVSSGAEAPEGESASDVAAKAATHKPAGLVGRSFSSDMRADSQRGALAPGRKPGRSPEAQFNSQALPVVPAPSLFEAIERVEGDTLERIREDIGDCTRCRLHKGRRNIVFGVGHPKADLVFVGEGPGHDEDVQGIPFVGRAGQLLTQMIEAMSLRREDVYICNVIKCRPPENRLPEKDEIATCSPFLLRQLDVIAPKVIVCLGACAAQTLLGTNKSISRFRGEWFDYRGSRLLATYHPAYLLRNPNAKGEVWNDLKKVMAFLGLKPAPRKRA